MLGLELCEVKNANFTKGQKSARWLNFSDKTFFFVFFNPVLLKLADDAFAGLIDR